MCHIDYDNWYYRVSSLFAQYYKPISFQDEELPVVLECACGTGSMALRMALQGHRIYAFDKSAEMIAVALRKCHGLDNPPQLFQADFLSFELPEPVDLAYCLYDSINYLLEPEEVVQHINRVAANLKPNGVFVFDISTVYNSETHFFSSTQNGKVDIYSYTRAMHFDKIERIQRNHFSIYQPNGEVYQEEHLQRIYSVEEMRKIIRHSNLELVAEQDLDRMSEPVWNSLRVNFVCRKGGE